MERPLLRVLIVDDEAPARRYMRRLLEAAPGVAVVGEAAALLPARGALREQQPDVVFLDIELGAGTGFDLLDGLLHKPHIVFVTAHAGYAARAFDVQAADYLLKPVRPERLGQALNRIRPRHPQHLNLRTRTGWRMVPFRDLTLILAEGDYVRLCCRRHSDELVHSTLKRLTARLPSPPFCRLSRSVILNLDHVARLEHQDGGCTKVHFNNGVESRTLGRAASQRLRRAMAA